MKMMLRISIGLNLALVSGLTLLATHRSKEVAIPESAMPDVPMAQAVSSVNPAQPKTEPEPFHWRQLESPNSYRTYVANLRAAGCPEPTIQDIVRGDTGRAFAWERRQLGLDGTGSGPWSQAQETQLEASLMGAQPPAVATTAPTEGTGNSSANSAAGTTASSPKTATTAPAYPLFTQNVNWSALGFTPDQQSAIMQVRQQYENAVKGLNQVPSDLAGANSSAANPNGSGLSTAANPQTPLQIANGQLSDLLGGQGYMAYEQQQYYMWYQPQVVANAGGGNLTINPNAFR
ncbi:MAG TPA: hypothetical protein VNX46_06160 [Candidatus Acidoferrum sp.]|jgi:hypothetical protein|nr:hypothetical protein [Candidatus Acidoferrum sp.]